MADDVVVRYGREMYRVDVTPELARLWLATCPAGDLPEAARVGGTVARYAAAMRGGTWRLMPLPIIFSNGRLMSSRFRLTAVVLAGVAASMYVCDGGRRPPMIEGLVIREVPR